MKYLLKIRVEHVLPPIPIRSFDWCAYVDGEEERGNYGYGRTKEAAINDLLEIISEESD